MFRWILHTLLGIGALQDTNDVDEQQQTHVPTRWIQPNSPLSHDSTVTPAPDPENVQSILKRDQTGTPFIGWWSIDGIWTSQNCPSGDFFAAESIWAACCGSTSQYCYLPTACVGNEILASGGATGDCATQSGVCDTLTIMLTPGAFGTQVRSMIECFPSSYFYLYPRTIYRATFDLATTQPATVQTRTEQTGPTVTKTETIQTQPVTTKTVTGTNPSAASAGGQAFSGGTSLGVLTTSTELPGTSILQATGTATITHSAVATQGTSQASAAGMNPLVVYSTAIVSTLLVMLLL